MPSKLKGGMKRARGVPVQIYVSEAEASALSAICEKRGITVSTLVRQWIRRATPKRAARAARVDGRQMKLC